MHQNVLLEPETDNASEKKAALGIKFFFIYLFFYVGFVALGVFNYELLSVDVFKGINLAVFYGIGLIVFAVILGILYNYLCTRYENQMNKKEDTV